MIREKKIGFHYSLYKAAKYADLNEKGETSYPLAINVTYNRKSTKFPYTPEFASKSYFTEQELAEGIEDSSIVKRIEYIVEKVVRYESNIVGDKYQIKGIKDRIDNYTNYVHPILDSYIVDKLKHSLGDFFSYNEFSKLNDVHSEALVSPEGTKMYLEDISLFWEYSLFDGINFTIKEKLSELMIEDLVAFSLLQLYLDFYGYKVTDVGGDMMLLDWILIPSVKLRFKEFIKSNLLEKAAKVLSMKDDYFKEFYQKFEDEILETDFSIIQNSITRMLNDSFPYRSIDQELLLMKKDKV